MARRKTTETLPARVLAAALPERHHNDPAMLLGNPLRGLTPLTAAALLSDAMRGCWTRAQWLMYYVEQWDADVWTLVERRCAGLRQLDWTIRTDAQAEDQGLAERQKQALHAWYSQVENMREAVEFLALAKFRGYAHLSQSPFGSGRNVMRLEPVDQWWWVRDGLYGPWYYNPEAKQTTYHALGEPIDEGQWIVREEPRCLLWLAILKFLRANQNQKWWDRFCEEAARQGTVIVGPPGMTAEQQTEFEGAALSIARSGSGVLGHGSDVKRTGADAAATSTVWEQRLRWLQEQLILAGTGGMLTALSQPTGIGGSQGQEQGDVWRTLLRADAGDISEVLQEQVDRRVLSGAGIGEPILAWFELDASEKPSTDQVLDQALKASQAGYTIDAEQVSERTGYELVEKVPMAGALPQTPPRDQAGPSDSPGRRAAADAAEYSRMAAARGADASTRDEMRNRAGGAETAARVTVPELAVPASWSAPVAAVLEEMQRRAADPAIADADLLAWLQEQTARLPELAQAMDVDGLAQSMEAGMRAAVEQTVEAAAGA